MATHVNFFENLNEALSRLKSTVVLYDGSPEYIWTITDHKGDGKFRVYMSPVEEVSNVNPPAIHQYPHGATSMGPELDAWMSANPNIKISRKMMNSPAFNRFRPFPLGMMNTGTIVNYLEREPSRPKMEQGLQSNMIASQRLSAAVEMPRQHAHVDMYSEAFKACVLGSYPSPNEVLTKLTSGTYANEGVAFHRHFALIRGPIDTLFLAYKDSVVGVLPNGDYTKLKLGKKFKHVKEVAQELNLFVYVE